MLELHRQIRASLFAFSAPVGRHPLMPPRVMHPAGQRRSDLGIAPYAKGW